MKLSLRSVILILGLVPITLSGCAGGGGGAGYWFHIIFVLIPLIIIGALLWRYSESTSESLFVIEGQLRRLSNRIEELEEKILENKTKKPKKQKEEKTPEESPREEEPRESES